MISFIIPIYNAEPYLVRCIHSVLKQTTSEPLQVILVDDGSTDNSLAIAQEAAREEKRIVVLRQPHAGQSAARNLGLKHAQGEYVAFVDADDTIAPDWCEKHVEAIEGVDYVQSGNPRNRYQYTVVWNRLYRREAITGLSFPEGMIYEDVLWSVDLWLSKASCRVIRYNGYHYTTNPESTTSRPHPEDQKILFRALRERYKNATLRGKLIIAYTICRLKIHFLQS